MQELEAVDSQTAARAVAVSVAAQVTGKAINFGLNIVVGLALIRYFGPAGYGDYVFVMSVCALFGLISDFGLTKVALRDMAREPDRTESILGTAIVARLALALASLVIVQLVLLVIGARPEIRLAAAVASLQFVTDALLSVVTVFQLRLATQYEALVSVTSQLIDTLLILFLTASGAGLVLIVAAPVVGGCVGVGLAAALARLRFRASVRLDFCLLSGLVREAFPVGVTLLLAVAYLKLDSVLLGLLATPIDVGLYGAAYKPVEYVLLVAAVLVQPLFTLLSRWHTVDPERFLAVYRRGAQALLAYTMPVAVILAFVADPLVRTAYTPEFAPAALAMNILSLALIFMALSSWQGFALLASGRQRVTLAYDAVGLMLNAVLNVVLIRWLGYLGAALAALATSGFVAICAGVAASRLIGARLPPAMLASLLLANAGLAGVLWLSTSLGVPWLLAAIVGGLSYPIWLLVCRVMTTAELRFVLARPAVAAGKADL